MLRRHTTNLRPQDLLKIGKPYAICDSFVIVAGRAHTIQPPGATREVTVLFLAAYRSTGMVYDPIGRVRPMPFNATAGSIGLEARLWMDELVAASRQERAA